MLATPVERRRFDADGHAYASHGDYPQAMISLGRATRVPVVDLTADSMRLWDQLGVEGTKKAFLWQAPGENPNFPDGVSDNTHFQAHGAIEVARLVVSNPAGNLVEVGRAPESFAGFSPEMIAIPRSGDRSVSPTGARRP